MCILILPQYIAMNDSNLLLVIVAPVFCQLHFFIFYSIVSLRFLPIICLNNQICSGAWVCRVHQQFPTQPWWRSDRGRASSAGRRPILAERARDPGADTSSTRALTTSTFLTRMTPARRHQVQICEQQPELLSCFKYFLFPYFFD